MTHITNRIGTGVFREKRSTRILFSIAILILITLPPHFQRAATLAYPSKTFQLENGLQVFLEKNESTRLVHIALSINVGSKDESDKTSGLVHLLEHLIFMEGARDTGKKDIIKEARRQGILLNAHTGRDLMTMRVTAPRDRIDYALEMIGHRVFHLELDAALLEREKEVILEEISGDDDDPYSTGFQLVFQSLFQGHTYERPIIGTKEIIKNATLETINTFKESYFIPNNCSLAVVGDFQIEKMEQKIRAIYSREKKTRALPERSKKIQLLSQLKKDIVIEKEMDIKQAHLFIGFIAPGLNGKDRLPAEVLSDILGGAGSPVLWREVNYRKRLVDNLTVWYYPWKYGGAMVIYVTADPRNFKNAKGKIFRFLLNDINDYKYSKDTYQDNDFKAFFFDYLECTRNRLLRRKRESREQGINRAVNYAERILNEGPVMAQDLEKRLKEVNSEALRRVAAAYLSGKKRVIVTILPGKK
ncbi:MAG: insulinase family protein [bacterium]|nr:insulinase family protein [bacterium]